MSKYSKEVLAGMLNGRQRGEEITESESEAAKESGLIVVFGYSDDNAELRGAIDDEVGCFDGGEIYITKNGVLNTDCACGMYHDCDFARMAFSQAKKISAIWGEDVPWSYETDIPHATFDIFDGEDLFCRGIVFSIEDLLG